MPKCLPVILNDLGPLIARAVKILLSFPTFQLIFWHSVNENWRVLSAGSWFSFCPEDCRLKIILKIKSSPIGKVLSSCVDFPWWYSVVHNVLGIIRGCSVIPSLFPWDSNSTIKILQKNKGKVWIWNRLMWSLIQLVYD